MFNTTTRTGHPRINTAILIAITLSFLLIPSIGIHQVTAQTYDTQSYIEWQQHITTVNIGAGANSKPTLNNIQFNITRPHNWDVIAGNTSVLVTGYAMMQGDTVVATSWSPQIRFNNSIRHWLVDDSTSIDNGCILGEFQPPTSSGADEYYSLYQECKLKNYTFSGAHDLDILDFAGCAASSCPDGSDLHITFTLINREKITFRQPDARTAIARIEANLIALRNNHNITQNTINRIENNLALINNHINMTQQQIIDLENNLTTIIESLTFGDGITGEPLLKDSTNHGYDLSIYRFGSDPFPNTRRSGLTNITGEKFANGIRIGYYPNCECAETTTISFLPGSTSTQQSTGAENPYNSSKIQNLSFFAAYRQTQNTEASNYTKFTWSNGNGIQNFDLECFNNGDDTYTVFYAHSANSGATSGDSLISSSCSQQLTTVGFIRNHTDRTVKIYVNGILELTISGFGYILDFVPDVGFSVPFLGQEPTSMGKDYSIYEMRLWNQAINETTMLKLMNLTDNTYTNKTIGNEVAAWFFEPLPETEPPGNTEILSRFQQQTGFTGTELIAWALLIILALAMPRLVENKMVAKAIILTIGVLVLTMAFIFENPYRSIAVIVGFLLCIYALWVNKDKKEVK